MVKLLSSKFVFLSITFLNKERRNKPENSSKTFNYEKKHGFLTLIYIRLIASRSYFPVIAVPFFSFFFLKKELLRSEVQIWLYCF